MPASRCSTTPTCSRPPVSTPPQLNTLRWNPDGDDTLRPLLARLTVDADGKTASTPGFDGTRVRRWAYNAANDAQAIYLNYIGSAGGVFQPGDHFAFDNPAGVEAFRYLVRLINDDHVAPPASDTNDNGDFSRNQFLAGRMALFQSGTYNLEAVAGQAPSTGVWRCCPPALRAGSASPTALPQRVIRLPHTRTRCARCWPGWAAPRATLPGPRGCAIPAVLAAQPVYFDYWPSKGVDVRPFFAVLDGPRIAAPGGAGFAAGNQALKLFRRDVPGPQRRRDHPAEGPGGGQRGRPSLADL